VLPSGENASDRLSASVWLSIERISFLPSRSHRRTTACLSPEASIFPSGEKTTERSSRGPSNLCSSLPDSTSQRRTGLPPPQARVLPSGEKATVTAEEASRRTGLPVAVSQRRMSSPPEAVSLPSGDTATA